MTWTCPRCGGEILDEDKDVCDGCIAEEVAVMFEDGPEQDDDEQ